MNLKEFYGKINSDYDDVLLRLGKEERIVKFAKLFFKTGDYEELLKYLDSGDAPNAFEFAHRLKGNALNIGFSTLKSDLDAIVEALRPKIYNENIKAQIFPNLENLKNEYGKISNLVQELD